MGKALRPYHVAAVESVFKYFADGMGKCPLIVAHVGDGKSLIHAELIKRIDEKKEDGEKKEAVTKLCPSCGATCHASQKVCYECSYAFVIEQIQTKASSAAMLSQDEPPREYTVLKMTVIEHLKWDSDDADPRSMKATYITLSGHFSEYICFEHVRYEFGNPRRYAWDKAVTWHNQFDFGLRPPITIQEALTMGYTRKAPTHVWVKKDGKYDRVVKLEWRGKIDEKVEPKTVDILAERHEEWLAEGVDIENCIPF